MRGLPFNQTRMTNAWFIPIAKRVIVLMQATIYFKKYLTWLISIRLEIMKEQEER